MAKILVVDDDRGMREFLEIMLTEEGHEVEGVSDAIKAIAKCKKETYDLVITDLKMPKMDGIEFLRNIKELTPEVMVILITAFASRETALQARTEGAFDYIEKDFDIDNLKRIVSNALEKKGILREEALFLKGVADTVSFGNMIGKSKEMLKVYSIINKVVDTKTNVLILGESGTGKELVARAIHNNSSRKGKPIVVINCGGIPESLLESELFGHMRGAFTGANADKPGLFELAQGGTVFLDEVGELPNSLQVKLLRVVQEKSFRRVGGAEDIKVDVRIIAATNQNLRQKVAAGTFREDLFYRLNVIPIWLPPLRKRKDDIPVLTRYFIDKYAREFGKEIKTISTYAMQLLVEYPFPGNVRELENIIERSIALETSNIILPESLIISGPQSDQDKEEEKEITEGGINLNEELAGYERTLIEKVLMKTKGSKTKAAQLLHVSYDSLTYRIEKLGIKN
ncbi:MAG: sigma-54 dependent transcriptional regulator [Smithellaceae bacterium]|nr:sigma-54 dependent transcriptional regulator [Smithellaceae bacterium]